MVLGIVLWLTGSLPPVHAQMTGGEAGGFSGQETAVKSEINMQLETLRREVERQGHSFTVGYNPAMEIPLDRLCGLKEPENLATARSLHGNGVRHGAITVFL